MGNINHLIDIAKKHGGSATQQNATPEVEQGAAAAHGLELMKHLKSEREAEQLFRPVRPPRPFGCHPIPN